ncbi:MAG: hypothetical protein IPJ13_14905 [Saprospiraceae bacterium]|nr:hypothetical protein [Saprospiraceae bacterium]
MIVALFCMLCFINTEYQYELNTAHDFHLSRCEFNYETTSGDVQIAAHIFLDDLENAIALKGRKGLFIATAKESKDCDEVIENYINKKLTLKVNGKFYTTEMIGKELSKDKIAVWCYLEIAGMRGIKTIEIENKILTELFNDQKNIVDFTVNKKKRFFTIFDDKKVTETYLL